MGKFENAILAVNEDGQTNLSFKWWQNKTDRNDVQTEGITERAW